MRVRDRQTRARRKDAALEINSMARLDAPQFTENYQEYARVAHRPPEKHHNPNANAATKRDATQRKQQSHALSAETNQKTQATVHAATARITEQIQRRATRRAIGLKNVRNACDVRTACLESATFHTQMPPPNAMRPNEYDQRTR